MKNLAADMAKSIESLLPELRDLVDGDWASFDATLSASLEQLRVASDEEQSNRALVDIFCLLARHPRAHARLVEVLPRLPEGVTTRSSTKRNKRRHVDLSCPGRVCVDTPRIQVVVRLQVEATAHTVEGLVLELAGGLPVQIRLEAPGFALLDEPEQAVPVLKDRDSPPVVFDIAPRTVGMSHVTCELFQGGDLLGTCSVPVEITAHDTPTEQAAAAPRVISVKPGGQPPDLTLTISYESFQQEPVLVFTLRQAGEVGRTFRPVKLRGAPEEHAGNLYKRLTDLVDADMSSACAQADRQVRRLGQNLWRELVPDDLKALYAANREVWRGRSMLLLTDEPYFPWELLWPYASGDWEDDEPWCMSFGLSRWLRRDARGNGHEAPPSRLTLAALACVSTEDSNLEATSSEQTYLGQVAKKQHARDVSPKEGSVARLMDLLESGDYSWLHVASHGDYNVDRPSSESVLWLQDDQAFTPEHIIGRDIEGHIAKNRPAFVFNACHAARQGWALTRLGGWANRLISTGSGLFLAPMWTVTDTLALSFCRAFYDALVAGETVAGAVRKGRSEARVKGDPSWLAYSVYAHPNARLAQR